MYLHEPGIAISVVNLPPSVKVLIRQNEKVNPDGTIGLRPDVVIKQEKRSVHDKDDANDAALGEALKLAIEKATKNTAVTPSGGMLRFFAYTRSLVSREKLTSIVPQRWRRYSRSASS